MSLNNGYGKCCKCPARMNLAREFTDYTSPSIRERDERLRVGAKTVHDYDRYLEENGDKILNRTFDMLKDEYVCKNNGENLFFVDSTDFHQRFTDMNDSIPPQTVVASDKKLTNYMTTEDTRNYTLRALTGDKAIVKASRP